jgi:hypothetical protein
MSYDPLKRDSSWQMIAPGLYMDPAGYGHIFPDEFLAFLTAEHPEAGFDPNCETDYNLVVQEFQAAMRRQCPGIQFKIVKHEKVQH